MNRAHPHAHNRSRALARPTALAVLIALSGGAGCGTSTNTPTSVYLEIYDGTIVSMATDVTLDVVDPMGGQSIGTLQRPLTPQTSATGPLGSVVILAGADGGVRMLHITGKRSGGGAILSAGTVDVTLQTNRQVSARLTLVGTGTTGDAGAIDAVGAIDTGAPPTDTGGSRVDTGPPPVDTGPPPVDAGTDSGAPGLANGVTCSSANVCGSGFCVDGVCCDNDCSALCHGCNLAGSRGTCKTFAAGTQCVPAACNANDALIPARICDGNGICAPASTPTSCGNYRCDVDVCLRTCTNNNACVFTARCFSSRCN